MVDDDDKNDTFSYVLEHLAYFINTAVYNHRMSSIIQFTIKKDEDGVYCAKAIDFPIFTSGKTLPELEDNIREATALYMEDEDLVSLGISAEPSLLVSFEIPH